MLEQLTIKKLDLISTIQDIECKCNINMVNLNKCCFSISSKVFTNNYAESSNNDINIKKAKRKLSTLAN